MKNRSFEFLGNALADASRLLDVLSIVERGARARMTLVWLVLTVRFLFRLDTRRGFLVRWRGPHSALSATVFDISELRVLREVFVSGEYHVQRISPSVILDLGSNVGFSVLYFRDLFPDAKIIAVEPATMTYDRLRRNTKLVSNVRLVQAAVTGEDTSVTIYAGVESWATSLFADADRAHAEQVDGLTVDSILALAGETHADFIKMDIEGAETVALTTSEAVRNAEVIVFEFHQEHAELNLWDVLHTVPEFEVERLVGHSGVHPLVTLRRRA